MGTRQLRDAFGVRTLYADAQGRTFERIDEAGPTNLSPSAVSAWGDGTFHAGTRLVEELTPLPLGELSPARVGPTPGGDPEPCGERAPRGEAGPKASELTRALDDSIRGLVANSSPTGRRQNRRVEIEMDSDRGESASSTRFVNAANSALAPWVHCLLSGGIDSAAIVDSLHRQGHRVIAHALVDDAVDEQELRRARVLVARLGVELLEHRIDEAELPAFFNQAVIAAERPIFNARGVSLALFMHRLRQGGVTAAFSGIGADEVFHPQREARIQTVFEPKTLPPTVWAARHFGLQLLLPYLCDDFVRAADAQGPTTEKRVFREAFEERLGAEVCFAAKSPRMFKQVARSPLWRDVVQGGDDVTALSSASFAVLKHHFAHGPNPPRHLP